MGWKDWPSWLKGGVRLVCILLLIFLVLFLLTIVFPDYNNTTQTYNQFGSILALITAFFVLIIIFPALFITKILHIDIGQGFYDFFTLDFSILGWFLVILFWSVIGAIIGWIVGKIRNK